MKATATLGVQSHADQEKAISKKTEVSASASQASKDVGVSPAKAQPIEHVYYFANNCKENKDVSNWISTYLPAETARLKANKIAVDLNKDALHMTLLFVGSEMHAKYAYFKPILYQVMKQCGPSVETTGLKIKGISKMGPVCLALSFEQNQPLSALSAALHKAVGYQFRIMPEGSERVEDGVFYVRMNKESSVLNYIVKSPENSLGLRFINHGSISQVDLPELKGVMEKLSKASAEVQDKMTIDLLKPLTSKILEITGKRDHTDKNKINVFGFPFISPHTTIAWFRKEDPTMDDKVFSQCCDEVVASLAKQISSIQGKIIQCGDQVILHDKAGVRGSIVGKPNTINGNKIDPAILQIVDRFDMGATKLQAVAAHTLYGASNASSSAATASVASSSVATISPST